MASLTQICSGRSGFVETTSNVGQDVCQSVSVGLVTRIQALLQWPPPVLNKARSTMGVTEADDIYRRFPGRFP